MIDHTTHTDDVTPEEMAQIVARPQRGNAPAPAVPDAETTAEDRMKARSVKLPQELDSRVEVRAAGLGMSKSAYFRWLAEKDLKNAYSDEPEMVSLEQAREIAIRAVDEALARLSHRPGHAA
ncbi:hypothetical protein HLB23_04150 [Nocardia uniformis]|uniref:Uncharacterized protein n=1 Tax=Nocardia uniformis TaxID=53432 RepID=A0A849C7Y1_9NOCA|nr:hypothetical protein [Nocardia uniformis]NNH69071.1 hypothetical protein [Nocardia uniformis]